MNDEHRLSNEVDFGPWYPMRDQKSREGKQRLISPFDPENRGEELPPQGIRPETKRFASVLEPIYTRPWDGYEAVTHWYEEVPVESFDAHTWKSVAEKVDYWTRRMSPQALMTINLVVQVHALQNSPLEDECQGVEDEDR